MRIVAGLTVALVVTMVGYSATSWAQGQSGSNPNAHSGDGRQNVVIRGETMGFVSVSPALQKAVERKNGKKSDPDPEAMGPNAEIRDDGFTYVSPSAQGKKQ